MSDNDVSVFMPAGVHCVSEASVFCVLCFAYCGALTVASPAHSVACACACAQCGRRSSEEVVRESSDYASVVVVAVTINTVILLLEWFHSHQRGVFVAPPAACKRRGRKGMSNRVTARVTARVFPTSHSFFPAWSVQSERRR